MVLESRNGLGAGDVAHNESHGADETHHQLEDDSKEESALHNSPRKKVMPTDELATIKCELIDRIIVLVGKSNYATYVGKFLPWNHFVKMLLDLGIWAINWPEHVPFPGRKASNGTTRQEILGMGKAQLTILWEFLTSCSHPSHQFQFIKMRDEDKGKTSCHFMSLFK